VGCEVQSKCTNRKDGIRYIKDFPYEAQRNIMRGKMKTPRAKEIYALCLRTVEPVFGDIKENKGLTNFLTRGLERVKVGFTLAYIASNLKTIEEFLKESDRKSSFPERSKWETNKKSKQKYSIAPPETDCLTNFLKYTPGIVGQLACVEENVIVNTIC
jgi:hypothetical protein